LIALFVVAYKLELWSDAVPLSFKLALNLAISLAVMMYLKLLNNRLNFLLEAKGNSARLFNIFTDQLVWAAAMVFSSSFANRTYKLPKTRSLGAFLLQSYVASSPFSKVKG